MAAVAGMVVVGLEGGGDRRRDLPSALAAAWRKMEDMCAWHGALADNGARLDLTAPVMRRLLEERRSTSPCFSSFGDALGSPPPSLDFLPRSLAASWRRAVADLVILATAMGGVHYVICGVF